MAKIGFDNEKYLSMQSERIKERIVLAGGKLYLEFGGKLFDDYHAARVLPGFQPDSKIRMLMQLRDQAEIVIVINAGDIEKSKVRGDLGITYEQDVLRLRFGLNDGRERTLDEIGKQFGVTRERIRQIEAKALKKLRSPKHRKKLQGYDLQ